MCVCLEDVYKYICTESNLYRIDNSEPAAERENLVTRPACPIATRWEPLALTYEDFPPLSLFVSLSPYMQT